MSEEFSPGRADPDTGGKKGTKEPYGDVSYADPGYQKDKKKRYPINTKDHVKAAWSYINQSGNASKYSPEQLASIKSKIKSAAKKFGIEIGEEDAKKPVSEEDDPKKKNEDEEDEETDPKKKKMKKKPTSTKKYSVDISGATVRLDIPVCRAFNEGADVETRSDNEGPARMHGHFSKFGNFYEINSQFEGHFLERVSPGAFTKTFQESGDKIRVLLEHGHDPSVGDKPLGVPRALMEDDEGASYEVELFDTSYTRDLVPALAAGVYGSSMRFKVMKDEWDEKPERSQGNPKGIPERTITEMRVFEFGPTLFPANPSATAGLRSTTDDYYDRVRAKDPDVYEDVVRRVQDLRTPPEMEAVQDTSIKDEGAVPEKETTEPRKHSVGAVKKTETTQKRKTVVEDYTMTVEERTARLTEIRNRLSSIDTEFNGAVLDEETQEEWDSLNEEYDAHERAVAAAEQRRARLAILSDEPGHAQPGTNFNSPAFHSSRDIYDITSLRRDARNMDDLKSSMRDNAMRAVESHRFPGGVKREDAQAQVEHLLTNVDDEEGSLARRILATGSPIYERAFGKAVGRLSIDGLSTEERAALAVGAGGTGGFAVPFQLDPSVILTSDGSVNPYRKIARIVQITTKTWQAVTSAGVTVARALEAAEASDNAPTLAQPEVTPQRVQGFIPFSVEVDADWGQLRSEMTMLLNDAKEQEENVSFTTGDGTGVNAGGIPATLAAGQDVAVANAAAFGADDVYALEDALPPRWRPGASFVANKSIYNLVRQFDTSGGAALWVRLAAGMPSELIGYPAYENSSMAAAPITAAEEFLLLGDFKQFVIVDRVGMSVELVPHLFGATNRFPTGQRGLFAIWRNTSEILVPGAFRVLKATA